MVTYPRTINEKAARVIGGVVAVTLVIALIAGAYWLAVPIAFGYWARMLAGPKWSPLGRLATDVIAPRLGAAKPVSGPPKRFAQAMGAAMTGAAALLALAFGAEGAAAVVLGMVVVAAGLEALFAYCVGCKVFGVLMRAGVVPEEVCAECTDIWAPRALR